MPPISFCWWRAAAGRTPSISRQQVHRRCAASPQPWVNLTGAGRVRTLAAPASATHELESSSSSSNNRSSMPAAAALHQPLFDDIIVTPAARRKLRALKEKAEPGVDAEHLKLRVLVDSGGCSGFKYSFEFKAAPLQSGDAVIAHEGCVPVVVDAISLPFLRGSTLDWVDEMMKNTFAVVNNPQSDTSCGCGSSFSAKA